MPRWTGSAELAFDGSARLAFAKALEEAQTDVDREQPEAWVVDDRRISFSVTSDTAPSVIDAYRRLLDALVDRASSGEAVIEVESTSERWARQVPSVSSVTGSESVDPEASLETIRTSTG